MQANCPLLLARIQTCKEHQKLPSCIDHVFGLIQHWPIFLGWFTHASQFIVGKNPNMQRHIFLLISSLRCQVPTN
jgi:hypothetical protein